MADQTLQSTEGEINFTTKVGAGTSYENKKFRVRRETDLRQKF